MKRAVGLALAFAAFLAIGAGHAFAQAIEVPGGVWTGTAVQTYPDGGTAEFTARIEFRADGTARIDYPSDQCGGVLTPLSSDGKLRFRETIEYGRDICVDGGTVTLTVRGAELHYLWTSDRFGIARGVLVRKG